MPKVLKIKKKDGQRARLLLLKKNWLDKDRIIGRTQRYLLFPLIEAAEHGELLKIFKEATIENRNLEPIKKKIAHFGEALEKVIPEKYKSIIKRSFDVIGDIAIVEVPKEFEKLEKTFAWTLRRAHPHINVVAKKAGATKGEYRLRKIHVISGESRTQTIHTEHGIKIKIDLNKVYFSPRLSGERLRIAKLVKPFERVLVMFAGVGPYPLVIAKMQPTADIWAVEMNPAAIRLLKENIKLNKFGKRIIAISGDVRKEVPKLKVKFDRIIMMLPVRAKEFLDVAFKVAAQDAIIHVYGFASDKEIPKKVKADVEKELRQIGKKAQIIRVGKCGPYAPHVWRVCTDLKVL